MSIRELWLLFKEAKEYLIGVQPLCYASIIELFSLGLNNIGKWHRRLGKKPRIGEKEKKLIAEIALKSPKAFGYLKNDWSIRFLANHLSKEVGIKISKSHLHRILHELGLAYKRPKAYVKSKDQDYEIKKKALESYKKIAKALLKKE